MHMENQAVILSCSVKDMIMESIILWQIIVGKLCQSSEHKIFCAKINLKKKLPVDVSFNL